MEKDKREKPFTMKTWDDFRAELAKMQPKSKMFKLIRAEMEKRGHYRHKPKKFKDS